MADVKYIYILGDQLPSTYDVAISLFKLCTRRNGSKAKNSIHTYQAALVDTWIKAFGTGHTMSRSSILKKLEKVRNCYCNEVYSVCSRKKPKHPTSTSTSTQTEFTTAVNYWKAPRINQRVCSDEAKSVCANLSSVIGMSVAKSRQAFQMVGNDYYNDELFLSKEEALEAAIRCSDNEPPSKKVKYDKLVKVVAADKTISNYKHMQASQVERDAGLALLSKENSVKAIFHYDTTSRCKIDGDWPSIILYFSDGREFELRPIFFAYEDREQIVLLLVETLKRLAVAATGSDVLAITLWENVNALMTDSVSKNLKIEDGISESFGSSATDLFRSATDLSLLTQEELKGLPTGNIKCERHLAVFDKRAEKGAKCRNRIFTAKSIRNDVMLYRNVQGVVDPATKVITKLLDQRELTWTENQKSIMKDRIVLKLQKAVVHNIMLKKLLKDCKVWHGPVTSTEEILEALRKNPDKQKFILRTELAYFTHTQKTEKTQRPDLFKQNSITDEEKLENLCILLSDDEESCTATVANLPTNEDGLNILSSETSAPVSLNYHYKENEMCIVYWMELNVYYWYVGYITDVDEEEESYVIDHLHRVQKDQNKFWHYPSKADKQTIYKDQLVGIDVKGEWTMERRNKRFIVSNEKEIQYKFNETIKAIC